ncbi:MAG: putative toxin-antitoxin system toxin component, PIN family [Clostridiales bacterium]|nr:putative toxin-antitoxin system toxin component, PIN family [Clostridiales bacterium]
MLKIVIDTNVIVSAALSPKGTPAKIIEHIADSNEIQVYYCAEMMAEYRDVLSREYLNLTVEAQYSITDSIRSIGILVSCSASEIALPDEDDRVFYDTAKASGAILITGNTRHYPIESFILTPSDFLILYEKTNEIGHTGDITPNFSK